MSRTRRAFVLLAVAATLAVTAGCGTGGGTPVASSTQPRSLPHRSASGSVSAVRSRPVPASPMVGRILVRTIPGLRSGFVARPALVYLPPVAQTSPHRRLPVLVLMHGTSGGPTDWMTKAHLGPVLSAFAASHDGAAPIVVMPDINGALHADTECVHADRGDVEQYLTEDVPDYIAAHFPAATSRRQWAVAGLSEGGTCAIMLSLRHPASFPTFGDIGGLTRPTVGPFDYPTATVTELFAGSRAAYDRHDPTWLLAHHDYPTLTGWFECGQSDPTVREQDILVALSRHAGISVNVTTTPGVHSWPVWRRSAGQLITWFWNRVA